MNVLDLQSRRVWLGGGAAIAVLILLAGWILAIHPKRTDAADLRSQNASAQLQNTQLKAQNDALVQQGRHLAGYQAKLAEALAALPTRKGLSAFSKSLTFSAQRAGVDVVSITVGSPAAVAAAPTLAPTSDASASPTASTETSAVAAPSTTAAAGPVSTTFTLETSGTTDDQLAFLAAIRTGSRSALITSTQFGTSAGTTGGDVTLTTQVDVFSAPMPAAQKQQLQQLLQPAN